MNELININNTELTVKEYKGVRVVTIKEIATLHQISENNIRNNLKNNADKMKEGIHYFRLTGTEITEWCRNIKNFDGTAPTSFLTLITERGYLLLVKTFQDDLSWQVQDMLVENYFKVKEAQLSEIELIARIAANAVRIEQRQKEQDEKLERLEYHVEDKFKELETKVDANAVIANEIDALLVKDLRKDINTLIKYYCKKFSKNYQDTWRDYYSAFEKHFNMSFSRRIANTNISKIEIIARDYSRMYTVVIAFTKHLLFKNIF